MIKNGSWILIEKGRFTMLRTESGPGREGKERRTETSDGTEGLAGEALFDREEQAFGDVLATDECFVTEESARLLAKGGARSYVIKEGVVEIMSSHVAEVEALHNALPESSTRLGSAVVSRSLRNPPTSLPLIHARQESILELCSNDLLRARVQEYLDSVSSLEQSLMYFLSGDTEERMMSKSSPDPGRPSIYQELREALKMSEAMTAGIDDAFGAQSPYIKALASELRSFKETPSYDLMHGAAYLTVNGMQCRREMKAWTPRLRFRPTRFSPTFKVTAAAVAVNQALISMGYVTSSPQYPGVFLVTVAVLGILTSPVFFKPMFDSGFMMPLLRQRLFGDGALLRALEAVGRLDELMTYAAMPAKFPGKCCMPRVVDTGSHVFCVKGMLNPVLAAELPEFVPNSIFLEGGNVFCITGPNSGGKSTLCRSILGNQVLGQNGAFIFGTEGTIGIADRITCQAPRYDSVFDRQGRFGTELTQTRDHFFKSTPRTLNIFDELAEGTTDWEKRIESKAILEGLRDIGGNTVLVTHDYELVESLDSESVIKQQVEFVDEKPTFRLVDGVSHDSHALRVAKELKFAPDDIDAWLREKGYRC